MLDRTCVPCSPPCSARRCVFRERQLEAFSSQLAAVMQDWKEVVDGEAWSRGALATAQAMADTAVAQRKDLIATAAAYKRRGVRDCV